MNTSAFTESGGIPPYLVLAGTAAIGLAAAMSHMCKSKQPEKKAAPVVTAAVEKPPSENTSKPKKKSKTGKKNAAKSSGDIDSVAAWVEGTAPAKASGNKAAPAGEKEKAKKSNTKKEKVTAPAPLAKEEPKKAVTEPSPEEDVEDDDDDDFILPVQKDKKSKETPEQREARMARQQERQRAEKAKKAAEEMQMSSSNDKENAGNFNPGDYMNYRPAQSASDGWAVVETKGKSKKNDAIAENSNSAATTASAPAKASEPALAPAPVPAPTGPTVEIIESSVRMDAKKVGGIIGPKGTTRKALEDVTGCVIEIPRDRNEMSMTIELTLSGTKQAVAMATKAINDFNTKGYIGILEGEDFSEGHMSVHPRNIPDLIGKGGTVRKALEAHTGVRINIPPNVPRTQTTMVKVDLAGSRSKIAELKKLVKELVKYGHTSITHPGMVHDEIEEEEVNATWYNLIIGKGGSEIRHIQNNFKVSVNIPNEQSPCENLLIVGLPQNVVAAKAYILKIIEKAITSRDKELQQAEADAAAERREESDDELEEEWMQQYIHPSKRKGTSAVNPAIDSAFPVLGSTAPPPTNDMSFPSAAGTDEAEGAASSAPQGAWAVTASGDPATPAPWAASTVAPFAT